MTRDYSNVKELDTSQPFSEFALARDLVAEDLGRRFRVAEGPKSDTWYEYVEGKWNEVAISRVYGVAEDWIQRRVKLHTSQMKKYGRTEEETLAKRAEKWAAFVRSFRQSSKLRGLLMSCKNKGISVKLDAFDANPHLIGVKNGVLDLSGDYPVLLDNRPEYLITKRTNARYYEAAGKRFPSFIYEILQNDKGEPDKDYLNWVQKLFGYTLSGTAKEDVVPIYLGEGNNGKSKLMEALDYTLGDYAEETDIQEIAGHNRNQSANNEALADLQGLRFAWCDEMPQFGTWDPAKFKKLTGSKIRAMRKFKPAVVFKSSVVIHLGGQHPPAARDFSHGFWRRVRVLPFHGDFTDSKDTDLLAKLEADADAILWWVVQGWIRWREEGLGSCATVDKATRRYCEEEESNTPLGFLVEACEVADPAQVEDPALRVPHAELYTAYLEHCKRGGSTLVRKRAFKEILARAGYIYAQARYLPKGSPPNGSLPRGYVWHGIRLREEPMQRWAPGG